MDAVQIEEYIAAILWGKHIVTLGDGRVFVFRSPTIAEKNHANYVHKTSLENYAHEGVLSTSDELIKCARINGEWTNSDENYFSKFDELIKVAYDNLETASQVQASRIQKQINAAETKRRQVCTKYNSLTYYSIEQQAAEDKLMTLIKYVAEYIDGTPVWGSTKEFDKSQDYDLLTELLTLYVTKDNDMDVAFIRSIVRSPQWRIRWNAGKENIPSLFGCDIRDLNDVQFSCIYWSQIYDSAFSAMDPPSDEVVNDDELFDKWMEKKNEEEKIRRKNRSMDRESGGKRGFYDRQGNFHSQGKRPTDHKEVGFVVDGYYDDDGFYHKYTEEEKMEKVREIQKYNPTPIRHILASESKILSEKKGTMKEEQLRRGKSRMLLNNFKGK